LRLFANDLGNVEIDTSTERVSPEWVELIKKRKLKIHRSVKSHRGYTFRFSD
jgi:hypothetical protein